MAKKDILILQDFNDGRAKLFGVTKKGIDFLKQKYPAFPHTEINVDNNRARDLAQEWEITYRLKIFVG